MQGPLRPGKGTVLFSPFPFLWRYLNFFFFLQAQPVLWVNKSSLIESFHIRINWWWFQYSTSCHCREQYPKVTFTPFLTHCLYQLFFWSVSSLMPSVSAVWTFFFFLRLWFLLTPLTVHLLSWWYVVSGTTEMSFFFQLNLITFIGDSSECWLVLWSASSEQLHSPCSYFRLWSRLLCLLHFL